MNSEDLSPTLEAEAAAQHGVNPAKALFQYGTFYFDLFQSTAFERHLEWAVASLRSAVSYLDTDPKDRAMCLDNFSRALTGEYDWRI
jgi:hypothetical protein